MYVTGHPSTLSLPFVTFHMYRPVSELNTRNTLWGFALSVVFLNGQISWWNLYRKRNIHPTTATRNARGRDLKISLPLLNYTRGCSQNTIRWSLISQSTGRAYYANSPRVSSVILKSRTTRHVHAVDILHASSHAADYRYIPSPNALNKPLL